MERMLVFAALAGAFPTGQAVAAEDVRLDTVLVTAERLLDLDASVNAGALGDKRLLDTPFSLTLVGEEDIALRQATTIGQIFINDPSVFSGSTLGTTNWWQTQIRGMGVRNYFVDGVPLMMIWGGEFPVEAVESVEALKGLAGFMYGFGAPGGVISYRTKKPVDIPLLETAVGYRNDGALSGHVDVGGRIGDERSLGYRINLAGEYGDAYNTAGINRTAAALALDLPVGENLRWHAQVVYEDSRLEHEPLYFYWDAFQGGRLPRPTHDYRDVTVRNSFYRSNTLQGSTGLQWRIAEGWSLDFTVGASRREHHANKMFAYLLDEAGNYEGNAYNFAGLMDGAFAQALVRGSLRTGALRHELVLGAESLRSTDRWGNDWHWSHDFDGNIHEPQAFLVTRELDFSLAPVSLDERQLALFASDTLHLGEHWQAILGARFTDYEQRDLDGDPEIDSGYATQAVSPTVALIYKPVDDISIYGSFVESLEAGGRVGDIYANAGELLDATTSRQYEIGAKYEYARVAFTTAAFRVERAAQIDQLRDGQRHLTQDGLTLYEGVEAIGSYAVSDDLRLGLGATWLDARIEDVSPENADLQGRRPAGVSRWQAVANADYRVRAIAGLRVHGNIRYTGDAFYEDLNLVSLPGRTLLNAGFQYETAFGGQQAVITGNINNLLDRKYWELNTLGEGINGSLGVRIRW